MIDREAYNLSRDQRVALDALTGGQVTDLTRAWVTLWDELGPELDDAVEDLLAGARGGNITRAQALRHRRLTEALALTEDRISELSELTGDRIAGDLDEVVKLGAYGEAQLIAAQLPAESAATLAYGFDRLPIEALDAITLRTTERIHALSRPLAPYMVDAMKAELLRGVAVGDNPRRTARRIMDRTEGAFSGGLSRALTISRTETLDAYRNGAQVADQTNRDILSGWIWSASLSGRTCGACLAMHGTEHPVSEPGPQGHQNCRCARLPKTKSFADLGIFGIDEPESAVPDAAAWFENLTPDSQRTILGKARHDAWLDGRYPMSDWAVKKSTPGWRDSWVVSPVPAAD